MLFSSKDSRREEPANAFLFQFVFNMLLTKSGKLSDDYRKCDREKQKASIILSAGDFRRLLTLIFNIFLNFRIIELFYKDELMH